MINIQPKTVSGQTATKIDVRLVGYPLTGNSYIIYYAYYTDSNGFISDGNVTVTGTHFSTGTNNSIKSALTASVGAHTNPALEMWDIGTNSYNLSYTGSEDNAWKRLSGALIPTGEGESLLNAALAILDVELPASNLVLANENVAYTWFGRPQTAGASGKQWIGVTKDIVGGTYQHIIQFDEATEVYTATQVGTVSEKDDHNNPSILVRDDGRLLVAYNEHNSLYLRYRISTNPYSSASFGSEQTLAPQGSSSGIHYCYSTLYKVANGDIIYIYRVRISDDISWYYMRSTDQGQTWGTAVQFQNMSGAQAYVITSQSDTEADIVHFIATDKHPQHNFLSPTSLYHYYIDFGDNTIHKSDGTDITALRPIGITDATVVKLQTSPNSSWMDDIIVRGGKPRVLFTQYTNGATSNLLIKDLYYTEWSGSAWTTAHFIARSRVGYMERDTVQELAYMPNAKFDVNSSDTIWAAIDVDGYTEIHRVTMASSSSFSLEQITFNTGKDNWRPITMVGTKNTVLWLRNNLYNMYTDYDMDLIALTS